MHVLMYHDIRKSSPAPIRSGDHSTSSNVGGQAGPAGPADPYSISADAFAAHLRAIAKLVGSAPAGAAPTGLPADSPESRNAATWAITFDDGRAGSMLAADLLEEQGWRGFFFVITDRIGTPGFLSQAQIVDLHRRGHVIGSHSTTHPAAMSSLPPEELLSEWRRSVDVLSELLEGPVETAAVPGGSYSHAVAAAAARARLKVLFTSEPTARTQQVDGCLVVGRYLVRSGTSAATAASLAAGRLAPRASQATRWKARNLALAVLGRRYYAARSAVLRSGRRR